MGSSRAVHAVVGVETASSSAPPVGETELEPVRRRGAWHQMRPHGSSAPESADELRPFSNAVPERPQPTAPRCLPGQGGHRPSVRQGRVPNLLRLPTASSSRRGMVRRRPAGRSSWSKETGCSRAQRPGDPGGATLRYWRGQGVGWHSAPSCLQGPKGVPESLPAEQYHVCLAGAVRRRSVERRSLRPAGVAVPRLRKSARDTRATASSTRSSRTSRRSSSGRQPGSDRWHLPAMARTTMSRAHIPGVCAPPAHAASGRALVSRWPRATTKGRWRESSKPSRIMPCSVSSSLRIARESASEVWGPRQRAPVGREAIAACCAWHLRRWASCASACLAPSGLTFLPSSVSSRRSASEANCHVHRARASTSCSIRSTDTAIAWVNCLPRCARRSTTWP